MTKNRQKKTTNFVSYVIFLENYSLILKSENLVVTLHLIKKWIDLDCLQPRKKMLNCNSLSVFSPLQSYKNLPVIFI